MCSGPNPLCFPPPNYLFFWWFYMFLQWPTEESLTGQFASGTAQVQAQDIQNFYRVWRGCDQTQVSWKNFRMRAETHALKVHGCGWSRALQKLDCRNLNHSFCLWINSSLNWVWQVSQNGGGKKHTQNLNCLTPNQADLCGVCDTGIYENSLLRKTINVQADKIHSVEIWIDPFSEYVWQANW